SKNSAPGTPTLNNHPAPGTLTFNLGLALYTKAQPRDAKGDTSFIRNAQAAIQYDRSYDVSDASIQLSLGGYFQYQIHPALIVVPAGSTIPATSIAVPGDASTL